MILFGVRNTIKEDRENDLKIIISRVKLTNRGGYIEIDDTKITPRRGVGIEFYPRAHIFVIRSYYEDIYAVMTYFLKGLRGVLPEFLPEYLGAAGDAHWNYNPAEKSFNMAEGVNAKKAVDDVLSKLNQVYYLGFSNATGILPTESKLRLPWRKEEDYFAMAGKREAQLLRYYPETRGGFFVLSTKQADTGDSVDWMIKSVSRLYSTALLSKVSAKFMPVFIGISGGFSRKSKDYVLESADQEKADAISNIKDVATLAISRVYNIR